MIRQLRRVRLSSLAAVPAAAAAAAAECGGTRPAAAALQLFNGWQHWSGGQGGSAPQQQGAVRHMSLWSGGGGSRDDQAAAAAVPDSVAAASEDLFDATAAAGSGSFAAAAAADAASSTGGDGGGGGLFSVGEILHAAAGAEADVLAAAAEDSWLGTRLIQHLLTTVHDATGLPWWQSIMLTTLGMRLATLPVMIAQIKNTYRMSQARPEMEQLVEYMREEQARGNTSAALEHQQRVMQVWKKYDCNPFKSLLGMFVQAPIFIGFFSALRGFAAHKLPSLAEGGTLWFTDLTSADPTFALPALAGLTFLATIELGAADGMEGQTEDAKRKLKTVMRVVAIAVPLVSYSLPASVFMYWTASNVFSLGQSMLLKIPGVKKAVGLPDLSQLRKASAAADMAAGKPVQTFSQRPAMAAPVAVAEAAPAAAAVPTADATPQQPKKPAFRTQRPPKSRK